MTAPKNVTPDEPEGGLEPPGAENALVRVETGVVPQREAQTALYELGAMSDEEFGRRIDTLKSGVARIEQLQRSLLTEDTDWGKVPGVPKAFLFKPGAEKLALFYHLVPRFDTSVVVTPQESGIDRIDYTTRCFLHYGSQDGPVLGEGIGVASSWETRHRWRKGERLCPVCGKPAIIKGKAEFGGGWLCWSKKEGCNTKWPDGTAAIESQNTADVENENPHDMGNTFAKMSEKRAHVDAVIRATGSSGIFTQDEDKVGDPGPTDTAAPPVPSGAAQRSQRAAPTGGGPAPSPVGSSTIAGVINKVPDGIRRETDGSAVYDLGFKVSNKQHWACLRGEMAERVVREVKPNDQDEITVEGDYREVKWSDDPKMPKKKEIHDITRVVIRDEVVEGGAAADPLPSSDRSATGPTASASTTSSPSSDLVDEAHETFEDMLAPKFGEAGYRIDGAISIITAERKERPKARTWVVVGTAIAPDEGTPSFRFVTDHDFDPPPAPQTVVMFRGEFVVAPDQATIARGTIS